MWVQISHGKGQFLGEGYALTCLKTLLCELCKNGWTDRFAVWVVDSGWANGSTSSIVFIRWHQCALPWGHIGALMGGHIDATWGIRLNHLCVAAMRPYVKLLWPLVIITMHRLEWHCCKYDAWVLYIVLSSDGLICCSIVLQKLTWYRFLFTLHYHTFTILVGSQAPACKNTVVYESQVKSKLPNLKSLSIISPSCLSISQL